MSIANREVVGGYLDQPAMKQYQGVWWPQGHPEHRCVGTLTFSESSGLELELLQSDSNSPLTSPFTLLKAFVDDNSAGPVHMFGRTTEGKDFSLCDGFLRSSRSTSNSPAKARYYFNRGIKGAHISASDLMPVARVSAQFRNLDSWQGMSPIKISHGDDTMRLIVSEIEIEPEVFQIDESRKLILRWRRCGPEQGQVQTHVRFRVVPYFSIDYCSPVSYVDAIRDINILANLLTVLFGSVAVPGKTVFSCSIGNKVVDDCQGKLLVRPMYARKKTTKSIKFLDPDEILLPLESVRPYFGEVIKNWFQLSAKAEHVLRAYFAGLLSPAAYTEGRFFLLASVLDGLHSVLFSDRKVFPKDERDEIWKRLAGQIPEDRLEIYKSRLAQVNDLTYKEKVKDFFDAYPSLSVDLIGTSEEVVTFCKTVKDLRNIEAHRHDISDLGGRWYEGIASKLRVIIEVAILTKAGLPLAMIEKAMRENRNYWYYASKEKWPWRAP